MLYKIQLNKRKKKVGTIASSGSRLGSTPNISKSVPAEPEAGGAAPGTSKASSGIPRSPARMGEFKRTSESK
jgi:hypothetical protein